MSKNSLKSSANFLHFSSVCCLVAGCSTLCLHAKSNHNKENVIIPYVSMNKSPRVRPARPAGHPRIAIYSPNYYRTTTTKNSSNHNALLVNSNERHKADDIINF